MALWRRLKDSLWCNKESENWSLNPRHCASSLTTYDKSKLIIIKIMRVRSSFDNFVYWGKLRFSPLQHVLLSYWCFNKFHYLFSGETKLVILVILIILTLSHTIIMVECFQQREIDTSILFLCTKDMYSNPWDGLNLGSIKSMPSSTL